MAAGRLFRGVNLYLVMAGLLSGAMIAAPIAYASNYAAGLHATVYGGWLVLEESLGHGIALPHTIGLLQLPLQIPYVILAAVGCLLALILVFYNRDLERKQLWIGRGLYLGLAHLLSGMLVRYLATSHVGESSLPDALDAGFQREFLLHLFILYFLWRAWRKQAVELQTSSETV
jgi:hypothetical protein